MCQLALGLRGDDLGREWQTDAFPPLFAIHEGVWCALIPHALSAVEGVADRRVEVMLIYEHVVAWCGVGAAAALYPVAENPIAVCVIYSYCAVGGWIRLDVCLVKEVCADDVSRLL